MPTYAENARRREIAQRRRAQDANDAARHRMFDLQAQDKTAKFERPQFAVVGEGSRTAQENYMIGYTRIFGPRRLGVSAVPSATAPPREPGVEAVRV